MSCQLNVKLSADLADPALRSFNGAVLDAREGRAQLRAHFAHLVHAGRNHDVAFVGVDEAHRGEHRGRAAEAAFLEVLDLVEANLAFNNLEAEIVFADVDERAPGDRRKNRVRPRNDERVVLINEEDVGAAGFLNVGAGLRIEVEVLGIAVAVGLDRKSVV